MITLRPSEDRGEADHGWLQSRHSFSFGEYRDPKHMGFGNLLVINEDRVAPGTGFGTHGHRDMEIISYVLEGALAHRDSLGTGAVIEPGEVQRMSAGSGIQHSEFNHSRSGQTHFLQIWIRPDRSGDAPDYAQHRFPDQERRGRLRLVVSPDGSDGSLSMRADARMYAGLFDGAEEASMPLGIGRLCYVHVARGSIRVNGQALKAGDAAKLVDESQLVLSGGDAAEVLVFDLSAG